VHANVALIGCATDLDALAAHDAKIRGVLQDVLTEMDLGVGGKMKDVTFRELVSKRINTATGTKAVTDVFFFGVGLAE
jgi:hypothetical protein